jgi:UPF0755 protein
MEEVMDLLVSGKSITYKISIPEGFTSAMALARIGANEVLTGEPPAPPPEGAIMPDTYLFKRGTTRAGLVADMQAAQDRLVDGIWAGRKSGLPIHTREQAVILASIVEKETAVADERPLIASVFVNRLRRGMRLQSDPTIIYGIVGGKGRLERPLTRADITTPTPYNTYTIDGLPPGPIANPGRAALEAVANPADTTYLYFVADGTGGHAFASSLDEHNRNVAKWRNIEGNAATAVAAEAAAQAAAAPVAETEPAAAITGTAEPAAEPAAPAPPAAVASFKPGTVIEAAGRLIPIPRRKPKL